MHFNLLQLCKSNALFSSKIFLMIESTDLDKNVAKEFSNLITCNTFEGIMYSIFKK